MTQKSRLEMILESSRRTKAANKHAAQQNAQQSAKPKIAAVMPEPVNLQDPEVAPHLFKKWVGDRVAVMNVKQCDNPNCIERGDFKAPKSPKKVDEYYWFCLEHVKLYNASWDYYRGMTIEEIEEAMRGSTTWERPTWPMGNRKIDQKVRAAFKRVFGEEDIEQNAETIHAQAMARGVDPRYIAQLNALREMGLAPPVDFETIKKTYRDLVKQHHPDVYKGGGDAEEKIKRINSAFTVLKEFYAVDETMLNTD